MLDPYPVGFYFELSFNGVDVDFQEVSGISKEVTIEEIWSGGENRFKYQLPTFVKNQNLVLKRALVQSGSSLTQWCVDSIDTGLSTPIKTETVLVKLLNAAGEIGTMWTFYGAYPVKYSVSDFKSESSEIVIESVELAYSYFDIAT